ncbi:MAG: sodium:calcium antiporter [Candidatus Bathyarchaeota archaeon]|nr:sodium:calcium antiporter [Candidatus Bathyarchaeota archaeon]
MTSLYLIVFIGSSFLLTIAGKWLVEALAKIAKFLGLKEFVVAFFTIAFATALPNLFLGILSSINDIPQLSLGDVLGGNIFDLTLVVALAAFVSKDGIQAKSRTVEGSSIFTIGSAILPLLLISDGDISRFDGSVLVLAFICYIYWLFNKEERFKKVYDGVPDIKDWKYFIKDVGIIVLSFVLLILGAKGIVDSASFFAETLNLPILLIGILIVGAGNALPETSFSFQAARRGEDWMILGNLMGTVMITTTLVLGVVALISPIDSFDVSAFAIGRIFVVLSAGFFLIFLRTGHKITRREGTILLLIFVAFLIAEIIDHVLS